MLLYPILILQPYHFRCYYALDRDGLVRKLSDRGDMGFLYASYPVFHFTFLPVWASFDDHVLRPRRVVLEVPKDAEDAMGGEHQPRDHRQGGKSTNISEPSEGSILYRNRYEDVMDRALEVLELAVDTPIVFLLPHVHLAQPTKARRVQLWRVRSDDFPEFLQTYLTLL